MVMEVKAGLVSTAFQAGGPIPQKYTCDGENVSPPLMWDFAPKGTKSFALIVEDPDAPSGPWVHWLVYDIPAEAGGLDEGAPKTERLENGAKQGMSGGTQTFPDLGYSGPNPPAGKPHRYFFTIFALDQMLNLNLRLTKTQLLKAMEGHILADAQLIGLYGR